MAHHAGMPALGQRLAGRYEILRVLGEGGFGTVYLARDGRLGGEVAVKVLGLSQSVDERMAARFRQEAMVARTLSHPHTIKVFDGGVTETGCLFMVMEYVRGESLAELIQRTGGLPEARAVAAPELLCGKVVTPAVDIYAVGLILLEMVSGESPFTGLGVGETVVRQCGTDPVPIPSTLADRPLGRIIRKAVAKEAGDRYPRVDALLAELLALETDPATPLLPTLPELPAEHTPPTYSPAFDSAIATTPELLGRPPRRRSPAWLVAALAVAAVGTAVWVILDPGEPASVASLAPDTSRPSEADAASELDAHVASAQDGEELAGVTPEEVRSACATGAAEPCLTALSGFATKPGEEPEAALALYREACERHMAEACRAGAQTVPFDSTDAALLLVMVELYWRGCEEHDVESCRALADLRLDNVFRRLDAPTAAHFFTGPCDEGHPTACALLGMIRAVVGTAVMDGNQAAALLRQACSDGVGWACSMLGVWADGYVRLVNDPTEAVGFLGLGCEAGDQMGCMLLGFAYTTGAGGLSQDVDRGRNLIDSACNRGEPVACGALGRFYEEGNS